MTTRRAFCGPLHHSLGHDLWRAVDAEGEVLEVLAQPRRDAAAAGKLMRKLLKKQGSPRTSASPTSVRLTVRRFAICGSTASPTYGPSGKTTGPKARLSRSGDASASCSGSTRPSRRRGSWRCTPRPTTPSTSAATSRPPARTGFSEPRHSSRGARRPDWPAEAGPDRLIATDPEQCAPLRRHQRCPRRDWSGGFAERGLNSRNGRPARPWPGEPRRRDAPTGLVTFTALRGVRSGSRCQPRLVN